MGRQISWPVALLSLAQAILFIGVMAMGILAGVQWEIIFGLLILGIVSVTVTVSAAATWWILAAGWGALAFIWTVLLMEWWRLGTLEHFTFFVMWTILAAVLASGQRIGDRLEQRRWRAMAVGAGLLACSLGLVVTYAENEFYSFYTTVLVAVALLVACRIFFRLGSAGIQFVNTLILLCIGLPLADAILRPDYQLDDRPERSQHYYSFEAAKKDPVSFAEWWYHFQDQWKLLHQEIAMRDPKRALPYLLRTNRQSRIFESTISINSLGFRGPEIDFEKGDAYRIVTIGESTTFGCTIRTNGKPWPRVLEKLLRDELDPGRPIQVINAGRYAFTLRDNLGLLRRKILALKPDMIISYHGYNGFHFVNAAIPPARGEAPPSYLPRPIKLLADLEYRINLVRFKARVAHAAGDPGPAPAPDPMQTEYARAYRKLIEIARANDIRLVVANYSMAVNSQSDLEVIEFYRAGFPNVFEAMEANRIHSEILVELAKEYPKVRFVNTNPGLDGDHEKFIDLVHFTQEGRDQMAQIFFDRIKDLVRADLAKPGSSSRERAGDAAGG